MTINFDPYVALGLTYGVTNEEIRTQYRKLVKELHPDKNPNDPKASEKFHQVVEAYKILSNPSLKSQFDAQRQADLYGGMFTSPLFQNLKTFATKLAHDYIDQMEKENESVDPNLFEIFDISQKSSRSYHQIVIRLPKENMDIIKQDSEYWLDQLSLMLSNSIEEKL